MVTADEKAFVTACLEELSNGSQELGSLSAGRTSAHTTHAQTHREVCSKDRGATGSMSLCRALEAHLQLRARNGADCLFVEPGFITSLGGKKVVQLELRHNEQVVPISVCWDWDMKLEAVAPRDEGPETLG